VELLVVSSKRQECSGSNNSRLLVLAALVNRSLCSVALKLSPPLLANNQQVLNLLSVNNKTQVHHCLDNNNQDRLQQCLDSNQQEDSGSRLSSHQCSEGSNNNLKLLLSELNNLLARQQARINQYSGEELKLRQQVPRSLVSNNNHKVLSLVVALKVELV
jgi:hypothetical protein